MIAIITKEILDINVNRTGTKLPTINVAANDKQKTSSENLLNAMFDVVIFITMFLCFFALSTNMSANLYE